MFKLNPPKGLTTKNFHHHTYYEVVVVKNGVATCKMEFTRKQLLKSGWTEIADSAKEVVAQPRVKAKRKKK